MTSPILKKATLQNSGVWTTTIIWQSLPNGQTKIITKQRFKHSKKNDYTREEIYEHEQFDQAYDDFHKKLRKWI